MVLCYHLYQVNKKIYQAKGKRSCDSVLSTSTAPPCRGKITMTQKGFKMNTKIQKLGVFISGRQHSAGTVV